MKISSVRLGHANNSSSTHSILLNSSLMPNPDCSDFQYGWEWFHLKGVEEKSKYLSTLVFSSLQESMSDEHAGIIAKELTGYNPKEAAHDGYAYVDHQSVICFPKKYGEKKNFHHGFLKDFVAYVRNNPKVSIRGGNDNSDDPGENSGQGEGPREWSPRQVKIGDRHAANLIPRDSRDVPIYARKDGDWWILYNAAGGAKIRLSFNDNAKEYLVARTPELVDLKITDYCPHACCPPGVMVATPEGERPIESINVGDLVLTENVETGLIEPKRVMEIFPRQYHGELIEIEMEEGRILRLTPEHEVFTKNRGWVRADSLLQTDEIIEQSSAHSVSSQL